RRRLRPRAGGDATDLLAVALPAGSARPAQAAAHRTCSRAEPAGALGPEAADLRTESAATRTGRRRTRARDPSGTAERRGATALLLLTALICRELVRLRVLVVGARRDVRAARWARAAEPGPARRH